MEFATQEVTLSGVSTKQDFYDLRCEIQDLRADLKQEIQDSRTEMYAIRAELKQEIKEAENRLNNKIFNLENKLIKIIFANTFIVVTILATIMKLF